MVGVCCCNSYSMSPDEIKDFRLELKPGEVFTLESRFPLLCVYFIKISNVNLSIYIDGNCYKELSDFTDIAGIDCGNHVALLEFRCTGDGGFVRVAAVVFPIQCDNHRMMVSLPFFELVFSSRSVNEDFRITNRQRICIWPATPAPHQVTLAVNTENGFDVLKVYTKHGVTRAFSGRDSSTFESHAGLEYFLWESDGSGLSDNFSLRIGSLVEEMYPNFRKVIHGEQLNDVSLIFARSDEPMPTVPKPDIFEMSSLVSIIFAVTVILVLSTIIVVCWSIREAKRYREEFGTDSDSDSIKQLETFCGYEHAEEELPQPYLPSEYADKV